MSIVEMSQLRSSGFVIKKEPMQDAEIDREA